VIDRGPGVPVDQRTRIFERFARAGGDLPRANYGLGLAFCKVVVDAHRGRIWIDDAGPGAAFCIWLPDR
jgi:signal transduction histidine kinase